ncbi:hypothetical protein ACFQ48_07595 [Hymenobacter caeli]|uniref:Uncharacterized protein n=1 Tax=Hymenobacter caeli TaxID=2735894 RepID=A0ABX2FNT4_9BACT|nr:hypothetical protein [Hymenobacter caeli]NRT18107.1 hypothetical protein [Hymenobacter caeli]
MTTKEQSKQLGEVMEVLRKQDRTAEEIARMREGQGELKTPVIRVENRLEDLGRNVPGSRRGTGKHQQETTGGLMQITDLICGLR